MGLDVTSGRGVRGRWLALIGALLACAAFALAMPRGAHALVADVSFGGGMLTGHGGPGGDQTTVRFKLNNQGKLVVEIYDPDGVTILPPGCTRKDANTIQCPGDELFDLYWYGEADNDEIIFDLPFFVSFLTPSPTTTQLTVDGGEGNDSISGVGPYNDMQIGGPGNDTQVGGAGNDTQIGGPGNDRQTGQGGNDTQTGGPGNDNLNGGPGNDKLSCGGGRNDKGVGAGGNDKAKGCEEGKA